MPQADRSGHRAARLAKVGGRPAVAGHSRSGPQEQLRLANSMAKVPRICVVGSANVDLTFCTPRLPRAGETLAGHALHIGMGGKGANQAVAAARLGAKVAFVACVGQDNFGTEAISRYQAEGIDTSF